VANSKSIQTYSSLLLQRGGASLSKNKDKIDEFISVARAIRPQLKSEDGETPSVEDIVGAFKTIAAAQGTLKGLDGAAHEAYQRTHSIDEVDIEVSGRARRSAARAGAVADGLGACEFCELIESPQLYDFESPEGTLANRQVLLNATDAVTVGESDLLILVLYEPDYRGGGGTSHGGIQDEEIQELRNGRLVVVLGDSTQKIHRIIHVLSKQPAHIKLSRDLMTSEVASVQPVLYKSAGDVLELIEPIIRSHNTSAIHFVGSSLAGGVAAIAATILEGVLPLRKQKRSRINIGTDSNTTDAPLQGLGHRRTSAISLGAPPCMSSNVPSEFITSIIFGDDIVCRTSSDSISRFVKRTRRTLKAGPMKRQVGWMTETWSLAASNLKSHAHGSEGEEARLAVPGKAFLVRPRRLGHACSMHEVGSQLKGGREALRATVLWQLNDILLTKSLWKHHQLESYVTGLDRVQLRGLDSNYD
jgi:hypothetical protein